MADNYTATQGVGTNFGADEVAGVKYPRIKLALGPDGTVNDLAMGPATMSSSVPVTIASNQTAVPVSGTFWQSTQPVSGTFWQTTQPVSGTLTIGSIAAGENSIGIVGGHTVKVSAE